MIVRSKSSAFSLIPCALCLLILLLMLAPPAVMAQGGGEGTAVPQTISVTFEWDPMPPGEYWTECRIYEKSGETYTLLGTVAGDQTRATIPGIIPGYHVFVGRAFDGRLESVDSNEVVMNIPAAPVNFIILTGGQ